MQKVVFGKFSLIPLDGRKAAFMYAKLFLNSIKSVLN